MLKPILRFHWWRKESREKSPGTRGRGLEVIEQEGDKNGINQRVRVGTGAGETYGIWKQNPAQIEWLFVVANYPPSLLLSMLYPTAPPTSIPPIEEHLFPTSAREVIIKRNRPTRIVRIWQKIQEKIKSTAYQDKNNGEEDHSIIPCLSQSYTFLVSQFQSGECYSYNTTPTDKVKAR